jgi:hypothetical protein
MFVVEILTQNGIYYENNSTVALRNVRKNRLHAIASLDSVLIA